MKTETAQHESKSKLLDAALYVIRSKGYSATTIDDVCAAAGLTKGSFFHHFSGKEDLALQAAEHWGRSTFGLFASAPYHTPADPRDRVLGYVDFRIAILKGELPQFTCLLGTMVQETYNSHPAIREACERGIVGHASDVEKDIALAKQKYAPDAPWTPLSLALFTQAVLQGAFILAKATGGPDAAVDAATHLRRYLETQLPLSEA